MKINIHWTLCLLLAFMLHSKNGFTCESCSIRQMGRHSFINTDDDQSKWFAQYLYENQNWHEQDASEAHQLHHQGHDVHDKTSEEFHHLIIGYAATQRFHLNVEIPYVIRHSLEVDSHSILGDPQKSKGLGDAQLTGDYAFFQSNNRIESVTAGIKFPTGETKENNSLGTRFEPELQPGSGSYDFICGAMHRWQADRYEWFSNVVYVFKQEGAQDFRFGDLVSSSTTVEYFLNPNAKYYQTHLGVEGNIQWERKHRDDGVKQLDSGGFTFLLGPTVKIQSHPALTWTGSFLAPVVQDLGGIHQRLDFTWTLGGKVSW